MLEGMDQEVEFKAQGQQCPVLKGKAREEGLALANVTYVLTTKNIELVALKLFLKCYDWVLVLLKERQVING